MNRYLSLVLLMVATTSYADTNWYVCYNLDAQSSQPANVLLIAVPQGLEGLFDAANMKPPRELFSATTLQGGNSSELAYGPIKFDGRQDNVIAYKKVVVDFSSSGSVKSAVFSSDAVDTTFGNCILDPRDI